MKQALRRFNIIANIVVKRSFGGNSRLSGEVKDKFCLFGYVFSKVTRDEVFADNVDTARRDIRERQLFDRGGVVVVEVVYAGHLMSFRTKSLRNMRADSPRDAGDEDMHRQIEFETTARSGSCPHHPSSGHVFLNTVRGTMVAGV